MQCLRSVITGVRSTHKRDSTPVHETETVQKVSRAFTDSTPSTDAAVGPDGEQIFDPKEKNIDVEGEREFCRERDRVYSLCTSTRLQEYIESARGGAPPIQKISSP